MFWGVNVLEVLYIDVKISFGSEKYDDLIMRKSYIAAQISYFRGKKKMRGDIFLMRALLMYEFSAR